jgi:hypothetical protein
MSLQVLHSTQEGSIEGHVKEIAGPVDSIAFFQGLGGGAGVLNSSRSSKRLNLHWNEDSILT